VSEAACKTILCSGAAKASVNAFAIINHSAATMELDLAVNAVLWEIDGVVNIVHLFAEQKTKYTRHDVYPILHEMMKVENELAAMAISEAAAFLNAQAKAIHAELLNFHLNITGESADYTKQ
jgi:hypothetical protein